MRKQADRVPASEADCKAEAVPDKPERGMSQVRGAVPFREWTRAAERHVISAAVGVPADRACRQPAGVEASVAEHPEAEDSAVAEAEDSHGNKSTINTGMFKGEENDRTGNKR